MNWTIDGHTVTVAIEGNVVELRLACPVDTTGRQPTSSDPCRTGNGMAEPLSYCDFANELNNYDDDFEEFLVTGNRVELTELPLPVGVTWDKEDNCYVWAPARWIDDITFAPLLELYGPDAPRCVTCRRPYAPSEARAGFTTCEHCPKPADDSRPDRNSPVVTWIKSHRDQHNTGDLAWHALDLLLDDYRLHADTGTPLDRHTCEDTHCDHDQPEAPVDLALTELGRKILDGGDVA